MTYFVGNVGNVRLRRNNEITLSAIVKDADVTVTLNRVGFDNSIDNLLTGDKVTISTTDARGLIFFTTSSWVDGEGVEQRSFSAFVNVNAAGGLRFSRRLLTPLTTTALLNIKLNHSLAPHCQFN